MIAASGDPDVLSWFLAGCSVGVFLAKLGAVIVVLDVV